MVDETHNITLWLQAWADGDPVAGDELARRLLPELKKLVRQQLNRHARGSKQTTAALNDLYVRLMTGSPVQWENRSHFFGICARVMRQVLVDQFREQQSQKRGGGQEDASMGSWIGQGKDTSMDNLIDIDRALDELQEMEPEWVRVVEMRFFMALSVEETAARMNISTATVKRYWRKARLWLKCYLNQDQSAAPS